jgi:hypothetical protein
MKKKKINIYVPTEQDIICVEFCIKNGIKIFRGPNKNGTYYVGLISKGKEVRDPVDYNQNESWEKFYSYCRYYYEKYKDKV